MYYTGLNEQTTVFIFANKNLIAAALQCQAAVLKNLIASQHIRLLFKAIVCVTDLTMNVLCRLQRYPMKSVKSTRLNQAGDDLLFFAIIQANDLGDEQLSLHRKFIVSFICLRDIVDVRRVALCMQSCQQDLVEVCMKTQWLLLFSQGASP